MKKIGEYTLKIMKTAGWYNNWLFSLIKPHLKGEILEIGAGIGNFTELLLKEGNVVAIDINKKYISSLNKKFGNKVSTGLGNIEKGSYFFGKKQFDTLICLNVLEHIKDDKRALKNMYKLTKKGGRLVILAPAHQKLYSAFDKNLGHFRRYSKHELNSKLAEAGYKIAKLKYLNWWAAIGWFLLFKLGKKKHLPTSEVSFFDKVGRLFLFPEKYIEPPFGLSVLATAEKI